MATSLSPWCGRADWWRCWLDTSLFTYSPPHKTNKRNSITQKRSQRIQASLVPTTRSIDKAKMKITVLLSILPVATAAGPFVPWPYEPFGIYKQRQWVILSFWSIGGILRGELPERRRLLSTSILVVASIQRLFTNSIPSVLIHVIYYFWPITVLIHVIYYFWPITRN